MYAFLFRVSKKGQHNMEHFLRKSKLVSSAFALLFTEISVVRGTEISVKSSAKADKTS